MEIMRKGERGSESVNTYFGQMEFLKLVANLIYLYIENKKSNKYHVDKIGIY